MWRYLVGALAALLLAGAGVMLFKGKASAPLLPAMPRTLVQDEGGGLPDAAPAASDKTREEKRFSRYDKDRDGRITRDEYLIARKKAFARLDTDHDGKLSFDEWAVKALTKFQTADADKSGAMSAGEFATTAVKRKAKAGPRCACPAATPAADEAN